MIVYTVFHTHSSAKNRGRYISFKVKLGYYNWLAFSFFSFTVPSICIVMVILYIYFLVLFLSLWICSYKSSSVFEFFIGNNSFCAARTVHKDDKSLQKIGATELSSLPLSDLHPGSWSLSSEGRQPDLSFSCATDLPSLGYVPFPLWALVSSSVK